LPQGEPRPRFVDHRAHALFQRVEIISGNSDGDLHQMQGIAIIDLPQGAAAVVHALHRAAVLATHARQMHLIGLNDILNGIDGGVAVIGLGDVHRQR